MSIRLSSISSETQSNYLTQSFGFDYRTNPTYSTVKASTPSEVAELFNQYFASVFASDQGIPAPERENVQLQDSNPFLTDVSLSVSQVELILRNLDTSKATGPDELPARILKETADV